MKLKFTIFLVTIAAVLFSACNNGENTEKKTDSDSIKLTKYKYPERTQKSNIYEVNIRQYTPEGTFKAFEKHIPRFKKMGVDILWIMPVYPISERNRKGSKGSYYAVQDYKKINPEFGTEDDFRELVELAHKNGMLLILDWVANHTGWDNAWINEHPDWYTTDSIGNMIPPVPDWTDVADLNYDNKEMRAAMIDALRYWVQEFDVDGYRCDVAGMVPVDFWNTARTELDKIKPVFMLAEGEQLDLHDKAFDMGYAWNLHHIMNEVAKGEQNVLDIREYFEKAAEEYPKKVYRMAFTSNHDENSWNGTVFERMPDSYKTWAVFSFVVPGMPLIYSGQEVGLNKRLKFFDKDTIQWKEHELTELYTKLIELKNENSALWNGEAGGDLTFVEASEPEKIFAFVRKSTDNKVMVLMNLTNEDVSFKAMYPNVKVKDYFTGEEFEFNADIDKDINMKAWEYRVLILK